MKQVTNLTSEAKQKMELVLDNGETATFRLYFYQTLNSWFFDIEYNDYNCYGQRVVLTANALRHLQNIIPFGIAFLADGNVEPFQVEDFGTQRVKMYVLNEEDIEDIENLVYG